ncbi:hypothetical protein CDAR_236011 [Caerostris darwini]|uniref:Uncharacterized protein n=1 Tax=Caerostris darwini TaxID=1538125 RepID=A0AAV4UG31_9ARAC|nr:hypothetical protein CDAR_236011 [Caerostris darwini]
MKCVTEKSVLCEGCHGDRGHKQAAIRRRHLRKCLRHSSYVNYRLFLQGNRFPIFGQTEVKKGQLGIPFLHPPAICKKEEGQECGSTPASKVPKVQHWYVSDIFAN